MAFKLIFAGSPVIRVTPIADHAKASATYRAANQSQRRREIRGQRIPRNLDELQQASSWQGLRWFKS
jgi:hypothetical protein